MSNWLNPVRDRFPGILEAAAAKFQRSQDWVRRKPLTALWVAGVTVVVALLIVLTLVGDATWSRVHDIWHWYRGAKSPSEALAPIFTLVAGLAVAWIAWRRHFEQTNADRQRRITESFSKAVEQLGNDKLEVRLGGIYALERISKESPDDYWTVMENLTAFVRERTQRTAANPEQRRTQRLDGRAYELWKQAGQPDGRSAEFREEAEKQEPPEADIAAVLTVIKRRSESHRAIEAKDNEVLDFREAFLRSADLREAQLERANLSEAHLEHADFFYAHLERAVLHGAQLDGANLIGAHLDGATLVGAQLKSAHLTGAQLKRAILIGVQFEGADLREAQLDGAHLRSAEGLTQTQIDQAFGDAVTMLPEGLTRPAHWTDPTAPKPWENPDLP